MEQDMITIVAKSIVKDGMKENFKQVAKELITESRKEEGCISYYLYEGFENKKMLAFIEEWKDENAIQIHNESEHFKKIIPELAKFREGNPEISLFKLIEDFK